MILDCMERAGLYAGVAKGLEELFAAEVAYAAEAGATGGRKVHGKKMYINDSRYETKPVDADACLEAHRRYIDVMYMLEGEETILIKPTERIRNVTKPYDEAGDAMLGALDGDETIIHLGPGQFVVLFPQDAHCPSRCAGEPMPVRKLVGKLAVDYCGEDE